MERKNVVALLPTGYGKSDCYALFPLITDEVSSVAEKHIAVVISPLKAVMEDQVQKWTQYGIKCAAIMADKEMDATTKKGIKEGEYSVIFASPEAVVQDKWWDILAELSDRVCLLAIDEVHCVLTWGLTFRPDFLQIHKLKSIFTKANLLALTATITEGMMRDIEKHLHMEPESYTVIGTVPHRPSIHLAVERVTTNDYKEHILWYKDRLVKETTNCPKAIIYARSYEHANNIYAWLITSVPPPSDTSSRAAIMNCRPVELFHGHTSSKSHTRILCRFKKQNGTLRVVVATIAFGMGVDVPDVRYIIHWGPAKNGLSYWQEVGRCSRDDMPGNAITYVYPNSTHPDRVDPDFKSLLDAVISEDKCLREMLMKYFFVTGMEKISTTTVPDGCCCACDKKMLR